MSINIRQKGASGEREIADQLNTCINVVRMELGLPVLAKPQVQRNQNQTAVGGCDLVGTYEYAIEVKRHEQLSINTWWKQCKASAEELNKMPVLVFRQNKQKWRVITETFVSIPDTGRGMLVRAEIDWEDFKKMFMQAARHQLEQSKHDPNNQTLFA